MNKFLLLAFVALQLCCCGVWSHRSRSRRQAFFGGRRFPVGRFGGAGRPGPPFAGFPATPPPGGESAGENPNAVAGGGSSGRRSPFFRRVSGFRGFGRRRTFFRRRFPVRRRPIFSGFLNFAKILFNQAEKSNWNRTLDNITVSESSYVLNNSFIRAALIRSKDYNLKQANFTGAVTIFSFTDSGSTQAVRPGFRFSRLCVILPEDNTTLQEASDTLSARNGTTIDAPTTVLTLNATGTPLSAMEVFWQYLRTPALSLFCGFNRVVRAVPADAANFPGDEGTATEAVLRMVGLNSELKVLVPRRRRRVFVNPFFGGSSR